MSMNPSYRDRIVETAVKLGSLPHLEPAAVAGLLGRRLQLAREDDYTVMYHLVGGPGMPFLHGHVFWMKKLSKGEMMVEVAAEAQFRPLDLLPEFADPPGDLMAPDVREPYPKYYVAIRVPVGEMLVACPTPKREIVEKIIVTESPRMDWEGDALARKDAQLDFPNWHERI